jgi:Ca2+-binding RTX toxin-like protein
MTGRRSARLTAGRFAVGAAAAGLTLGVTLLNGGVAHAVGALCDGRPASRPSLDASGQPGPSVMEGTRRADVIIGSDGDDTIDGRGGNDVICGGPGDDTINVGPGGNAYVDGGPGDDGPATVGTVHSVTFVGGAGDDDFEVGDTIATSYLYGGSGDDRLMHEGTGHVKADGGDGFDICTVRGGDEVVNCEY